MMFRKIAWIGALSVAVICPSSITLSDENFIPQQLVGRWEGRIKQINAALGIRFSPTGRLVFTVGEGSGVRSAITATYLYSINPIPKPMHLDYKPEKPTSKYNIQPVQTIFELLNSRALRLQTYDLRPGKPRPTKFDEPVELSKVSDSAIVFPDATQLAQAEQSQDGEGRLVMQNLALTGLYYSVEMQQFPKALKLLGLSNDSTQNYRYQIQSQSRGIALIARPKKDTLKSYVALISQYPVRGRSFTTAILCESVRPSRIAPPIPFSPAWAYEPNEISCGSGSQAIDF